MAAIENPGLDMNMPGLRAALDLLPLPVWCARYDPDITLEWGNQAVATIPGGLLLPGTQGAGRGLAALVQGEGGGSRLAEALRDLEAGASLEQELTLATGGGVVIRGIFRARKPEGQGREPGGWCLCVFLDTTSQSAMQDIMESSFNNFIQTTNNLDQAMRKIRRQRAALAQYRRRMVQEMQIAHTVQRTIIPRNYPHNLAFDCQGFSRSSEEIGGDYLDVIQVNPGLYAFLVADVSGHGVGPALITTMLKAWVAELLAESPTVESFLGELNHRVWETFNETGFYLTAFFMLLDIEQGVIQVSSAGHDALLRIRETGWEELGTLSGGRVIGALADSTYTSQSFQLAPGDLLVIHTDGISEARDPQGGFYGRPRLAATLGAHLQGDLSTMLEGLQTDLDNFAQGEASHDDQTILVVRWKSNKG